MNIAIRAATLQCAQSRNGQMHAFSDSDGRGFGFEVQLSLTKKGQYAVAYCLS